MFIVFKVYPTGRRDLVGFKIVSDWRAREAASTASVEAPFHCVIETDHGEQLHYRRGIPTPK